MVDQPGDEKLQSWVGKRVEDMTDSEREKYEKNVADRFTWQPGDLIYLGNEPLTEEVKNPQRTFPIAIIGSLIIASVLYIIVTAVLNGMVPYSLLGGAAPVAFALNTVGVHWADIVISVGALAGLTSVILVGFFGQSRVFYAMARDGLLPSFFAKLHKVFKTPINGIIVVGVVAACLAAFLPIIAIAELVNIGTLAAFIIVSASVLILRRTRPDIERPFRTPFLPWVPILGILSSLGLDTELPTVTQLRFLVRLAVGLFIYYFYGRKNSLLTGKHGTGEEEIKNYTSNEE